MGPECNLFQIGKKNETINDQVNYWWYNQLIRAFPLLVRNIEIGWALLCLSQKHKIVHVWQKLINERSAQNTFWST